MTPIPGQRPERIIRVKFGTDLPLELADAVDDYCRLNRVRKNLIVELALRRFLAEAAASEDKNG